MNIFTTFKLAIRALWRNKVRTLLTMLGIVFGIGAVIAMVAFGQGAQAAVKEVFANLGTNTLILPCVVEIHEHAGFVFAQILGAGGQVAGHFQERLNGFGHGWNSRGC